MTAELNEKVLALVEREIKKDPAIQSKQLQAKALRIDRSIGALTGRQFHAQYALQIRRRLFGGDRTSAKQRGRSKGRSAASPIEQLVVETYEQKRVRLEAAIERAFERAIATDSVQRINKLLSTLDRHARELEKA